MRSSAARASRVCISDRWIRTTVVAASRASTARMGIRMTRVRAVTMATGPSSAPSRASDMATPTTTAVIRSESSQAAASTGMKAMPPTVPYWCVRTSAIATSTTTAMHRQANMKPSGRPDSSLGASASAQSRLSMDKRMFFLYQGYQFFAQRFLPTALLMLCACTGSAAPTARATTSPEAAAGLSPTPTPRASPTPQLPAYYIESLRARPYPPGRLDIQDEMFRGAGFTKYHMTWPSGGQTMTGTISVPDGDGPFPVVVVNHGFIPPERYWIGQDSGIFGDPLAAHGFISVAPNWPGYSGSSPAPPDLPAIAGQVVAARDLVSALYSYPEADPTRLAFIGH